MRLNYKPIGDYIQRVEHRNRDLKVTRLLGLSMTKEFRETTSNIVGTDMSVYRVMSKYQFACDFMSPIRVNKLPVVLKLDDEPNLVSPAYPVFEIRDRNELDPEYLMMWFRRPEFDRYATFKCDAAIRGGYEWTELCETLIPIPSITKQREIVKEYNVIQNRIRLNQQLIQKLEETAQAVYKEWFVEFEFPDENGKPYKSSGGEMVWNEELEKEIPKGWEVKALSELGFIKHGHAFKGEGFSENETELVLISPGNFKLKGGFNFEKNKFYNGKYPKDYLLKEDDLVVNMTDLSKEGDTLGNTALIPHINFKILLHNQRVGKFELTDFDYNYFIFFRTMQKDYKHFVLGTATGTTVRHTSPNRIGEFKVIMPRREDILSFNKIVKPIIELIGLNPSKEYKLKELSDLLLSKLATIEN